MPRRSRRQSSVGVGRKSSFSRPSNVRSTRVQRFDISPVMRQEFLDEGNKALAKLLARDVAFQRARLSAERRVSIPRRRPPRAVSQVSVDLRDVGKSLLTNTFPVFSSTFSKVRDAVICARRAIRRELVFASGSAGSKKRVVNRSSPSSVRC